MHLSLHLSKCHIDGNHMEQLICVCVCLCLDLPSSHHLNMAAACSSQGEKATGEKTERKREIEQKELS